jgi:long-chain acyl-CoA synthetase
MSPPPRRRDAEVGRGDLARLTHAPAAPVGAARGTPASWRVILHNVEGCIDIIANDFWLDDEVFLSFLPRATPS